MIELTDVSTYTQGMVWYATPVPLWNAVTDEVASFTTTFSFAITQVSGKLPGDGMAFFLARYAQDRVLADSYSGGLLGLFKPDMMNDQTPVTGGRRVVAVEFDTFLNEQWDQSSQHVGIDVSSIKSVAYTNTSSPTMDAKNLTSGITMHATVRYDNGSQLLDVELRIDEVTYRVNATVDLKKELPEEVAVGFSAGTGIYIERHRILSWSFHSTLEGRLASTPPPAAPAPVPAVKPSPKSPNKIIAASVSAFAVAVGLLLLWLWRRKPRRTAGEPNGNVESSLEVEVVGPRRYLYQELATATDNFAEKNKLGQGGFGSVYKGRLLNGGGQQAVAIKRFSSESSNQGRSEFEAEVKIISQLRHRNLVQLLGWCDSPKGLLLVYELVPEGSLDQHLYNKQRFLTWPLRYKIILGLGSALRYLHQEWQQCVVHGDIKPSNIMLDSAYNTKLGDFGLARLVDHGTGPQTTVLIKGTVGYMDPEFVSTYRRSIESDVYSFGIVLLEIVSGRPPVSRQEPSFMLLKWVWSLYSQGAALSAADARLRTGDDKRQMERALVVGLWCAHPDPAERPSVAQAMHALQSEDARLPALQPQMYKQVAPLSFFGVGNSSVSVSSLSTGVRSLATTGSSE